MEALYDLVVVGAGIAGCTAAREAKAKGLRVAIIDKAQKPATGGSGAAGAFISPKLGSKTELLELTNEAFNYAVRFYTQNYPKYFTKSGIVRIPQTPKDAQNLLYHQSLVDAKSQLLEREELELLGIKNETQALFFEDGGFCEAQELCEALIVGIDYFCIDVQDIDESGEYLLVGKQVKAINVVLATGYRAFGQKLDYMGIKGLWGSRGDFFTDSKLAVSMHKKISVSAVVDGVVKLGATHVKSQSPCMECKGEPLAPLIEASKSMVELENLRIKETFCGMRSGSHDFKPLLGRVIDSAYMLQSYPKIKLGYKKAPLKYCKNLYVFNGLGGRGFVLAPLMAKWLIEYIFEGKELDSRVDANRLFLKWARRLNKLKGDTPKDKNG